MEINSLNLLLSSIGTDYKLFIFILALLMAVAFTVSVPLDSSAQLKVNVTGGNGKVCLYSIEGINPECAGPLKNGQRPQFEFDKDVVQVGERFWICVNSDSDPSKVSCAIHYNGPEHEPEVIQVPLPNPIFSLEEVNAERMNAIRDTCIESHVIPLVNCMQIDLDIGRICGIIREYDNPIHIEC